MRRSDRHGDTLLITAVLLPSPLVLAAFPKQGYRSWSVLQSPSVGFQWPRQLFYCPRPSISRTFHPSRPPTGTCTPAAKLPTAAGTSCSFSACNAPFSALPGKSLGHLQGTVSTSCSVTCPGRVRPCVPHTACGPYPWSPSLCGSQSPRMLSSLTVEPCPL